MAILKITMDNFEKEVLQAKKPVLLDFWATWCGPCRMIAPTVEEIAQEYDSLVVGKVDVDEERDLAIQFGITSIPTLVLMQDGKPAGMLVGMRSKNEILKLLDL